MLPSKKLLKNVERLVQEANDTLFSHGEFQSGAVPILYKARDILNGAPEFWKIGKNWRQARNTYLAFVERYEDYLLIVDPSFRQGVYY